VRPDSATTSAIAVIIGAAAAVCTLFGQERRWPKLLCTGVLLTIVAALLRCLIAAIASGESFPAVSGGVMFGEATFNGSAQRRLEIRRAAELGIGREMIVGREQITGSDSAEYSLLVCAPNGWWQQNVTVFRSGQAWTIRLGRERKAVFK
jgi:hypothetical protein